MYLHVLYDYIYGHSNIFQTPQNIFRPLSHYHIQHVFFIAICDVVVCVIQCVGKGFYV